MKIPDCNHSEMQADCEACREATLLTNGYPVEVPASKPMESQFPPKGFPTPREFVTILTEIERMLAPCRTKDFESYEDGPVKELGSVIGYGALMISASKVWRDHLVSTGFPPGGQFICGPCDITIEQLLDNIRGLLARTRG